MRTILGLLLLLLPFIIIVIYGAYLIGIVEMIGVMVATVLFVGAIGTGVWLVFNPPRRGHN